MRNRMMMHSQKTRHNKTLSAAPITAVSRAGIKPTAPALNAPNTLMTRPIAMSKSPI